MTNKFTVFTSTYNRAYTLENLYKSLLKQKYTNFEWLIVDDGSQDETKELVEKFLNEKKIKIKYYYQKNSGKHIAINTGVNKASGNLFIIVDSDDYLTDDALETIDYYVKSLSKDIKYAGVAGLKCYQNGNIIGKTFDGEFLDKTSLERRKNNILGDKAEVFYTEILKKYPFPQIKGEKFINEAYIWNKIANDGYKIRWFNKPLITCEYLNDGLSKNNQKLIDNNPLGCLLYLKDLIKYEKNYIKKIAHYCTYCNIADKVYTKEEICQNLGINKLTYFLFKILGKVRR